jgi:hypothetical protein
MEISNRTLASLVNARMLLLGIFAYTILLSVLRLQLYWSTQPWAGDFPFYVQCCTTIPNNEHLTVPIILYSINLFVGNPIAVTFFVSAVGYILIFLLVYLGVLQLTGSILASVEAYFCFAVMLLYFVTPTAIKNMYGLIFMLLSIIVFDKYLKERNIKLLIPLSLSVLLTAITHSIPIFPLTIIMLINVVGSLNKNHIVSSLHSNSLLLVLVSAGSAMTILMLEVLGKTAKLFDILRTFMSTPLRVIALNIDKYMRVTSPNILPLNTTLFTLASAIGFLTLRSTARVMFLGLFFATLTLFFVGDIEYGERLIENATPLVALLLGYCLKFATWKKLCGNGD